MGSGNVRRVVLAANNCLIVTGRHRSGTTHVARCIAYDRGLEFIAEERFNFGDRYLLSCFLREERDFVIQAPWIAPIIHQFAEWQPEVIWVNRPEHEIRASQRRMYDTNGQKIHWILIDRQLRRSYNLPHGDLMACQYENWQVQRQRFDKTSEVDYHDFDTHPLHQDGRENYHLRQTIPGAEIEKHNNLSGELVGF